MSMLYEGLSIKSLKVRDVLSVLKIGMTSNEIKELFNLSDAEFQTMIHWTEYANEVNKTKGKYYFSLSNSEEYNDNIGSSELAGTLYFYWTRYGVTYQGFRDALRNIDVHYHNTPITYAFFGLSIGQLAESYNNFDLAMDIYRFNVRYCGELDPEERKKPFVRSVNRLSKLEFFRGISPKETLDFQRQGLALIESNGAITSEDALLMLNAGVGEHFGGIMEEGELLREKGISLLEQFSDDAIEADALPMMVWHYYLQGNFKKTIEYYETFILSLENRSDKQIFTFAYPPVIFSYFFMGEYNSALVLSESIYRRALKEKDETAASLLYAIIGRVYLYIGEDALAERILNEAYNEGKQLKYGWCMYYALFGICYREYKRGNYERCKEAIIESREVAEKYDFAPIVGSPFILEALKCIKREGLQEIENYTYDGELNRYLRAKNEHLKGVANRHLAEMFSEEGESDQKVLGYLRKSLMLLERAGNTGELGKTCLDMAAVYNKLGNTAAAEDFANRAWRYSDSRSRETMPEYILGMVKSEDNAEELAIELQTTWLELREIVNEEQLQNKLLTSMCRTLRTESGALIMADMNGMQLKMTQNIDKSDEASPAFIRMENVVRKVVQTGEVFIGHGENVDVSKVMARELGPLFYIAIPFKQNKEVKIVLYLQSYLSDRMFTDKELEEIKNFADRMSVHLYDTINMEKLHSYGVVEELNKNSEYDLTSSKYCKSEDEGIRFILDQIAKVAKTNIPVLITGETGVGKEVIAREVYEQSDYRKTFIKVNCGAIPESLIESELFGYEKGSFTGAMQRKKGYFEIAEGGTILLDEIGELTLQAQVKLLRVLQERELMRVGGTETVKVNFRLIAATNKSLAEEVEKGNFRKDLFYRLNVVQLFVPPLRTRKKDIVNLSHFFAEKYARELGKKPAVIEPQTLVKLLEYPWPGNVRELENTIQRAVLFSTGDTLTVQINDNEADLYGSVNTTEEKVMPKLEVKSDSSAEVEFMSLDEMQKKYITEVLKKCGGKVGGKGGAAEILGLKRTTLISKMDKLGIKKAVY